jgi:hypothetical protein
MGATTHQVPIKTMLSLLFSRQPIPVVQVFHEMEIGSGTISLRWLLPTVDAERGMPPQRRAADK